MIRTPFTSGEAWAACTVCGWEERRSGRACDRTVQNLARKHAEACEHVVIARRRQSRMFIPDKDGDGQ